MSTNAWSHWLPIWHALFFIVLAICTALALIDPELAAAHGQVVLLTGLLYVWYGGGLRWIQQEDSLRAPYFLAYLATGWIVWFMLTFVTQLYMFLLFALFPHVFISLSLPWASVGAVILMTMAVLRQTTTDQNVNTWLLFMSVSTLAGIGLAYFINAIIHESTERRELIARLEAAQRELAEAERQAGILQERQRLAGEIHDTLAQGLTSIVTLLEAAENDSTAAPQHLGTARDIARSSLQEARRFIWNLRPAALENQSFEEAMAALVAGWSAAQHTPAAWVVTGERLPAPPEYEIALLRITQEALSNIARHAHARQVTVTLSYMPDGLWLDVVDDGVGFDASVSMNGHYGLIGMRERMARLGGQLAVESAPGEGTTLSAQLPFGGVYGDQTAAG
ncbi:MAG: sensor histidine kinase [Anaerolineae bacterium]